MNRDRIIELLQPFLSAPIAGCAAAASLSSMQLYSISTYIDILLRWNARINLTAIRDPEDIVTRHFGESLFVARHLFPDRIHVGTASALADLGSGAGFPAFPSNSGRHTSPSP